MPETVLYGAYGPTELVPIITGNPRVLGRAAVFQNVSLCVQKFVHIPDVIHPDAPAPVSPRQIMTNSWDENFETYTIRPHKGKTVHGQVFELTLDELAQMREWGLTDFGWFQPMEVGAKITKSGRFVTVHTEGLRPGQHIARISPGNGYPLFLNDRDKSRAVAKMVHEEYMARARS